MNLLLYRENAGVDGYCLYVCFRWCVCVMLMSGSENLLFENGLDFSTCYSAAKTRELMVIVCVCAFSLVRVCDADVGI